MVYEIKYRKFKVKLNVDFTKFDRNCYYLCL